ncbi:hypothetical protein [Streptomyces abikoensis]
MRLIEAEVRTSAYRERAERRRRRRGTGELRGDGWVRTEADERLLALATRYSTLTLRQAAAACWGGQAETARARVRLMTEAGLLHRSAEASWAGTVVWTTERGAQVAGTGLGAPRWPGERLLHRLAVADVGLGLEAAGHTVLTEREIRTADAADFGAWDLLSRLGARVESSRAQETFPVRVGARAVHWPDLVLVPDDGHLGAVEVELTPKAPSALRSNLRAYHQAGRRVLYLGTAPVVRQLLGRPGPDGWRDGIAQEVGLLPPGRPGPSTSLLRVSPLTIKDPGVAAQVGRHANRHRCLA